MDQLMDDLTPLSQPDHWLGWVDIENPAGAVRDRIEQLLQQQVPSATLDWLRIVAKPYFLTGAKKKPDDPKHVIVTRAALAIAFELQVGSDGGTEKLGGSFSWVAVGLDGTRRDRVWLDLNADFAHISELLAARIYELDDEPTAP